jgi:hypothetical protein
MTKYRRDFSLSFTAPSLRARTSALGLSGCPLHVSDGLDNQRGDRLELVDALLQTFSEGAQVAERLGGHEVQRIGRRAEGQDKIAKRELALRRSIEIASLGLAVDLGIGLCAVSQVQNATGHSLAAGRTGKLDSASFGARLRCADVVESRIDRPLVF